MGTQQRGREQTEASRSRLPRRIGSENPRAVAAGLGKDAEQSGPRAHGPWGTQQREESGKYLEQAVAAYRAALEVYTREQLPQQWALTQNNLGLALKDLGERSSVEESGKYLEQAVAAYRAALEVYTREQLPQHWANDAEQSGVRAQQPWVTQQRGKERKIPGASRSRSPRRSWKFIRASSCRSIGQREKNLGIVLRNLGKRSSGTEGIRHFQESVVAFENALTVLTPEYYPAQNEIVQSNLEKSKNSCGKLRTKNKLLNFI